MRELTGPGAIDVTDDRQARPSEEATDRPAPSRARDMAIRIEEEQQGKQGDGVDHVEADEGDGAEEGDRPGVAASADDGQNLEQVRERKGGADRQEDPPRPVPGLFRHDQRADRHPAHARDQHGGQSEHRAPLRLAEPRAVGDQRSGGLEDLLDPIRRGVADHDDRRGVGSGGAVTRSTAAPIETPAPITKAAIAIVRAMRLLAGGTSPSGASGPAVTSMPRWSHPRPPRARGRTPPLRQVPPPPPTVVAAGSSSQVRGPTVRSQTTARRR